MYLAFDALFDSFFTSSFCLFFKDFIFLNAIPFILSQYCNGGDLAEYLHCKLSNHVSIFSSGAIAYECLGETQITLLMCHISVCSIIKMNAVAAQSKVCSLLLLLLLFF